MSNAESVLTILITVLPVAFLIMSYRDHRRFSRMEDAFHGLVLTNNLRETLLKMDIM